MKKSKMFLGFCGPLKCCVCGRKSSKPVIFLHGRRYCPSCARFTLNFAHNVFTMLKAGDFKQSSNEGKDN